MGNRKTPLADGEHYHIYNRGVDKRQVFMDHYDVDRFFRCMQIFNIENPVGSVYESGLSTYKRKSSDKNLVSIVAYCLNPNHYHLILRQEVEGGISEYMKRLSGGYTWYFNNKYKRSGSLFQGRFKSIYVDSDSYLKHLSAYVNLNYKVHKYGGSVAKLVKSSWEEYTGKVPSICDSNVILGQFSNRKQYETFALEALKISLKNKEELLKIEYGG